MFAHFAYTFTKTLLQTITSKVWVYEMFVHASIRTSNMEKSIGFYTKMLGLKVLSRKEIKVTNAEIVFLQDPAGKGCTLELTLYRNQKKFTQPEYEERLFDHLGFEVADMDKTIAAMRMEKIAVTDEPFKFSPNTTIAFIEDPDGTLIELIERK
jgi:lactoylglutathione lyase